MDKSKIDDLAAKALTRFEEGPTINERGKAITELLTRRALSRVVHLKAFDNGLSALAHDLRTAKDPVVRLAALAQLGRIEQSARTIASNVRQLTVSALVAELPPSSLLKEADERFYVAKACSWVTDAWVLPYAIRAVVEEAPNADAVRAELVSIVFYRAASLSDVFARLATALTEMKVGTESPADSIARRLTKILGSLRDPIATSLLPPGDDIGVRLGELARKPFSATGLPSSEAARLTLAKELVMCTYDIVRTRFSVSTDADTYAAVKFARRLFPGTAWPSELKDVLALISEGILEAVLLLGKQGIASRSLVEHLELVSGYRERAEARLRELAEKNPGLPEQVRAWLKKETLTTRRPADGAIEESQQLRTDPSIGEALIAMGRLEDARSAVAEGVIPVLELYDPARVPAVDTLLVRVAALVEAIGEVAKRRRLSLLGTPGESMTFLPKYFESTKGAGEQQVRVLRPAVVRLGDDGAPGEAVVKGLVE